MLYGYLIHHGIKGQKWGIRRFQNSDGSLTAEGKQRYGKANSFNELRKTSKQIFKQSMSDYNKHNPDATLKQKTNYRKELVNNIKDIENRFIAKNYNKFKSSKDNVENTVLDIIAAIGGIATDVGGIFIATPVGLGIMAGGLTASTLSLGAKVADGAIDSIKNKRIEEALNLYGKRKKL